MTEIVDAVAVIEALDELTRSLDYPAPFDDEESRWMRPDRML